MGRDGRGPDQSERSGDGGGHSDGVNTVNTNTMTDGTTTGLVDAATVVKEADEKRKIARARVMAMKDDQSGQGFRF